MDDIITSQAWKDLCSITAEEGLVALGYERKHQQWRLIGIHTIEGPNSEVCV